MWQSLFADLKDRNFVVVAVAMDGPEAARPWIEAAKLSYPCLIDRNHHVADLYNMVNVPQAVWIDETGRIVRPPENAGASDSFRGMNRVTKQMTPEQLAERARTKTTYVAAVRDWVLKGPASEFALMRNPRAQVCACPTQRLRKPTRISGLPNIFCGWARAPRLRCISPKRAGSTRTPGPYGDRQRKRMPPGSRPAPSSGPASMRLETVPTIVRST